MLGTAVRIIKLLSVNEREVIPMKIPLRRNVLVLVGAGYATLLLVFFFMMWPGGTTADVAYEVVKGPLMALIGGSLAISKDLINLDASDHGTNSHGNALEDNGNDEGTTGEETKT